MIRKGIVVLALLIAAASVGLVLRSRANQLNVRVYFHNAQGLRPGAQVRANGLDVGEVKIVRLSPRLGNQPVEVLLRLDRRCAGRIPADSTAEIATAGILGPPYVEIDVSKAAGNAIKDDDTLKSVDTSEGGSGLQVLLKALTEGTKRLAEEAQKQRQTIDSQNSRTKK